MTEAMVFSGARYDAPRWPIISTEFVQPDMQMMNKLNNPKIMVCFISVYSILKWVRKETGTGL